MPFSDSDKLKIFLSYTSEDHAITEVLSNTLTNAFFQGVEVSRMSDFSVGKSWRKIIEDNIAVTDIFIAVQSGQLRPSHEYPGKEVGLFEMSVREHPCMKKFPHMDRMLIPFAVLTRPTAATNEFEGVDIDPDKLYDLRFNPDSLTDDVKRYNNKDFIVREDDKMLKLLRDLDSTINKAKSNCSPPPPPIFRQGGALRVLRA